MANFLIDIDDNVYVIINDAIKGEYKLSEKSHDSKTHSFYKGELKSRVFKECPEVNFQVITQLEGNKEFNEFYCTKIENGGIVIPAKIRNTRLPTDLRQWLIKEFDLDGSGGDFPDMFPELDRVTSDFQELDTHKIDKIMRAELARQGE